MKRLSIGLFFVLIVIGCSSKSQVVLKDTDYLKYGTRASVIEQAWGKPDETMAFQDYRAQSNYSFWGASGSYNRYGGSASGGGFSGTYTPTTIVWIYREKGYSLFFAPKGVFNEDPNPINIKIWKLVGWEKLKSEKTSLDDDKVKAQMKYAEKRINEAGITSDSDIRIFWAVMEKAPKEMAFEDQVEWAIKKTKELK
jgi:hypothetical protein